MVLETNAQNGAENDSRTGARNGAPCDLSEARGVSGPSPTERVTIKPQQLTVKPQLLCLFSPGPVCG